MLTERRIKRTPDHLLTRLDKGFCSLGLLHAWQSTGSERHGLQPPKSDMQYAGPSGCSHAAHDQSAGPQKVAAVARHGESSLSHPLRQRQGATGVDLDGRPDALPGGGHRRPLRPPLGNRVGLSRDDTEPATTQADPAQQENGGDTAGTVGVLLAYNLLHSQMVKRVASKLSFHMA